MTTIPCDIAAGAGPVERALARVERYGAVAAVEAACVLPRIEAVWVLDSSVRRGLTTRSALARCSRDVPLALQRLAVADGRSLSIVETAGRLALVDAGLPPPIPHYGVWRGGRLVGRLDAAYPDWRLGLCFGGASSERHAGLVLAGWRVLRFTWWDVTYRRERFVREVSASLTPAA